MMSKLVLIFTSLICVLNHQITESQNINKFPFDPYTILKAWNYDQLLKTMGNGEEILATSKNQSYLTGLKYQTDLLGMHGVLIFSFNKDSISQFSFRAEHEVRVTSANLAERKMRDPASNRENTLAIQKLDSLQRLDSLSRDKVVSSISEILGPAVSKGRTEANEKTARYSAVWINQGYACRYKDYINYSEIVFSLSTVPLWSVGEFEIPVGTEIIQKTIINTRKMNWTASLLGYSPNAARMVYSDIFLQLEFNSGQKYLVSLPKNPVGYLVTPCLLEFSGKQRALISIPNQAIGYLPVLVFEDCDGDAIPEAWIKVPCDVQGTLSRQYLFSLAYKEPNLIFNSDEQFPVSMVSASATRLQVTFENGTKKMIDSPTPLFKSGQLSFVNTKGFKYLNSTKLNSDGSSNLIGGIELRHSLQSPLSGILEITYKHSPSGWEPDQTRFLPAKN